MARSERPSSIAGLSNAVDLPYRLLDSHRHPGGERQPSDFLHHTISGRDLFGFLFSLRRQTQNLRARSALPARSRRTTGCYLSKACSRLFMNTSAPEGRSAGSRRRPGQTGKPAQPGVPAVDRSGEPTCPSASGEPNRGSSLPQTAVRLPASRRQSLRAPRCPTRDLARHLESVPATCARTVPTTTPVAVRAVAPGVDRTNFAIPKSSTFGTSSCVRKTLSGFKSRWTSCRRCAASTAWQTPRMMWSTRAGARKPSRRSVSPTVAPLKRSMTKYPRASSITPKS